MMNGRALPGAIAQRSYSGHYMKVGQEAETRIMEWLTGNPHILKIDDLRQFRALREADVDTSIHLTDGRIVLAEIKSDWHLGTSGNVLFEILRINHTAQTDRCVTLGWSARSPAKWLLYYAPQFKSVYQCLLIMIIN